MSAIRLDNVVVATVLPFKPDGAIDWTSYERLLDYCATPDGVSSVFVNGHAGEAAALTREERIEVIRRTRARIDDSQPLLAGIIAYSTQEAIEETKTAKSAGADVAVLFPLPQFAAGGTDTPDVPLTFVKSILAEGGLPVSIFQTSLAAGTGYTTETLVEMAKLPGVLAIKEGSGTVKAYEDNWRAVKAAAPDVAILPSNFDWFLAQVVIGADGILSGLASLTPHLLVDLWSAAKAQDLHAMREASNTLHPIVRTIYGAPPLMDMHTRIKAGLEHMGVISSAYPRPPLLPVSKEIAVRVTGVVDDAELKRHVPAGASAAK